MPARQIRDILHHVRQFYHQLCELYQCAEEETQDERVRLLLQYMERHEKQVDKVLGGVEGDERKSVLDTWLQFVSDDKLADVFRGRKIDESASLDEIIGMSLEFDRALVELYSELAASSASQRVGDLFESLLQMEEQKEHQYARSVLEEELG